MELLPRGTDRALGGCSRCSEPFTWLLLSRTLLLLPPPLKNLMRFDTGTCNHKIKDFSVNYDEWLSVCPKRVAGQCTPAPPQELAQESAGTATHQGYYTPDISRYVRFLMSRCPPACPVPVLLAGKPNCSVLSWCLSEAAPARQLLQKQRCARWALFLVPLNDLQEQDKIFYL